MLGESVGDGAIINEKISKGVFALLDESLYEAHKKKDKQRIEVILAQHKKIFGAQFGLIEQSNLDFDKELIKRLEKGQIISIEEDGRIAEEDEELSMLYRKLPRSSLVWRVYLDIDVDVNINEQTGIKTLVTSGKFSEGMFYLIESKLLKEKQEKWPEIIKDLLPVFQLPLSLNDTETISGKLVGLLNRQEKIIPLIQKGKVVNITQGSKNTTFVKNIPGSTLLLQIGPIEIPWFMRNFFYLMLFAFILSFATMLLLWIWPLWSNLIKIKQAADEFGSGNYNARIPYKKYSPIAKVSQAFNDMAERTQRSMRSQKELTTAVSHELRTPVARMRFALEMLSTSNDKQDNKRYLNDLDTDIDDLDLLLEELLSYARFDQENTKINRIWVKLVPWISDSIEKLMPLTKDKALNYHIVGIGVNEMALMEPRLMTRVLDNLVQNALRYALYKVEVTLSKDNDSYILIVEDDGKGIPESERHHIFDAFSRIDASRDRSSGGFGLGLAIADRIVKGHQGNITIHDSVFGGARIEVRWSVEA